jgi:hypothetical protein
VNDGHAIEILVNSGQMEELYSGRDESTKRKESYTVAGKNQRKEKKRVIEGEGASTGD